MSKQAAVVPAASLAGCTRLGLAPMHVGQAELLAGLLSALADPTRLRLISLIAAADEACVCDLTAPFTVSQPTISHHLRVLREAGLVEVPAPRHLGLLPSPA